MSNRKKKDYKEKSFMKIFKKSLIGGTIAAFVLFVLAVIVELQYVVSNTAPAYEKYVHKMEKMDDDSFYDGKRLQPSYLNDEISWLTAVSFTTCYMDLEEFYYGLIDMSTGEVILDNEFEGIKAFARYSDGSDGRFSAGYTLGDEQIQEFSSLISEGKAIYPIATYIKDTKIYIEKYCIDDSNEIYLADLSGIDCSGYAHITEVSAEGYEGKLKIANKYYYSNDGNYELSFITLRVNEEFVDSKIVEKGIKLAKNHKTANNRLPLDNHFYYTYYFEHYGKEYCSICIARFLDFDANISGYDDGTNMTVKAYIIRVIFYTFVASFIIVYSLCLIISAVIYASRKKLTNDVSDVPQIIVDNAAGDLEGMMADNTKNGSDKPHFSER